MLGDALRLRQLMVNYIGHAIDSTERGGVQVRVSRRGEQLRVDVLLQPGPRFAAVLMNMYEPQMNGIEATRALRAATLQWLRKKAAQYPESSAAGPACRAACAGWRGGRASRSAGSGSPGSLTRNLLPHRPA